MGKEQERKSVMKKGIKKMDENELAMMASIASIDPFDAVSIMICKGDIEKSIPFRPGRNDDWNDWSIPMKDMTRQKRRKYRFSKGMARRTMAYNLGYDMDAEINLSKVNGILSANHMDRMYFRGNKVQKKLGKAMTTIEGLNLMAQMEWEDAMDREAERKEVERQFMLDELASTTDDLNRLKEREADAKKAISELIAIIYEANNELQDYQVKMNGLRAGKSYLEDEIRKLEEALKQ